MFFLPSLGCAVPVEFRCLVFVFFININFYFGVCLQVKNIHQADSCKITPAKFSGSKEVVPLHFRKTVTDLICFE